MSEIFEYETFAIINCRKDNFCKIIFLNRLLYINLRCFNVKKVIKRTIIFNYLVSAELFLETNIKE